MPNIEVRDADGKIIHTYEIHTAEHSTLITTEHLFDMAKQNAIEDELVSKDQADALTFRVAE